MPVERFEQLTDEHRVLWDRDIAEHLPTHLYGDALRLTITTVREDPPIGIIGYLWMRVGDVDFEIARVVHDRWIRRMIMDDFVPKGGARLNLVPHGNQIESFSIYARRIMAHCKSLMDDGLNFEFIRPHHCHLSHFSETR